ASWQVANQTTFRKLAPSASEADRKVGGRSILVGTRMHIQIKPAQQFFTLSHLPALDGSIPYLCFSKPVELDSKKLLGQAHDSFLHLVVWEVVSNQLQI